MNIFMWIYFFIFPFLFQKRQKKPPEMFWEKGVLKNCANFIEKHLFWSLFLIKLQDFKKNYFEEHLCTTACKNTNICLKEMHNSFKNWPLNLWQSSKKIIMEVGNITKAATFKSFLQLRILTGKKHPKSKVQH